MNVWQRKPGRRLKLIFMALTACTASGILRRKTRYGVSCGAYKGKDRYSSKRGYPGLEHKIPGILLHPKKKEVIL